MNFNFKKIIPHLLVLLAFVVASVGYFTPVLQGKQIQQSDITQYIGMSKQFKDFNKTAETPSYWNDNAFGGMPTYQLGAHYPHNYIKKLDLALRFLPRPADYVFLYFISFLHTFIGVKSRMEICISGEFSLWVFNLFYHNIRSWA